MVLIFLTIHAPYSIKLGRLDLAPTLPCTLAVLSISAQTTIFITTHIFVFIQSYMSDLRQRLARLGLSQYLQVFTAEGFDTWETVLDITESDL